MGEIDLFDTTFNQIPMLFSQAEEDWLQHHLQKFSDEFIGVNMGEQFVNDFIMYSYDVPLSANFIPLVSG